MSQLAYAGLTISSGTGTVSLTTTAALLNIWAAKAADNASDADGNQSVQPDLTNNRILLQAPSYGSAANPPAGKTAQTQQHTYHVFFDLTGTTGGALGVTAQIRKYGASNVADLRGKGQFNTTPGNISFQGLLVLTTADFVAAKAASINQLAFANPSAPDSTHPYFTGDGGAPKNMVGIDVMLTGSGSDTLTVTDAHLTVYRLR